MDYKHLQYICLEFCLIQTLKYFGDLKFKFGDKLQVLITYLKDSTPEELNVSTELTESSNINICGRRCHLVNIVLPQIQWIIHLNTINRKYAYICLRNVKYCGDVVKLLSQDHNALIYS